MEIKDNNGRPEVELPGSLDLVAAVELRGVLMGAFANGGQDKVVLCAHAVERASTAVIQVIVAASASFAAASRRLEVADPSDSVAGAFRHLGLTDILADLTVS